MSRLSLVAQRRLFHFKTQLRGKRALWRSRQGNFIIFQRPFLHVSDAIGLDAIDDQFRIINRPEVLPKERVRLPDLLEDLAFNNDAGRPGETDLIVLLVEITELDFRIRRDFSRLVVAAKIRDIDGEAIRADGRDRPEARLIAVDGRQVGKPIDLDHAQCEFYKFVSSDWFGYWFCHSFALAQGMTTYSEKADIIWWCRSVQE